MRQLIFTFALKSFEQIECLTEEPIKEYTRNIHRAYLVYNAIRGEVYNPTLSSKQQNIAFGESFNRGEEMTGLIDNCPYQELKDSELIIRLEKEFRSFKI